MNIQKFLMDNYIWILVVLLLAIITVIGFLADKKKNGNSKNNKTTNPQNNQNGLNNNQGMPMNNSGMVQQGMPMNNIMMQGQVMQQAPMNPTVIGDTIPQNVINQMGQIPISPVNPNGIVGGVPNQTNMEQNIPNINLPNQDFLQPVNNNTKQPEPTPSYQPLSEQKPMFTPQSPSELLQNYRENNNMPVTPVTEQNTLNQGLNEPVVNMWEQPQQLNQQPMQVQEQPPQQPININPVPTVNTMNQPTGVPMSNYNVTEPAMTIQPQINQSVPQPIPGPQNIPTNNVAPMPNYPNSNMTVPQPVPNPVPTPVAQQPQPINNPSPVSFVFGPQNNQFQ